MVIKVTYDVTFYDYALITGVVTTIHRLIFIYL